MHDGGFGWAALWYALIVACVVIYDFAGRLPDLPAHAFVLLPFIAVGDLLNTIARWRTGTLLARVHVGCMVT